STPALSSWSKTTAEHDENGRDAFASRPSTFSFPVPMQTKAKTAVLSQKPPADPGPRQPSQLADLEKEPGGVSGDPAELPHGHPPVVQDAGQGAGQHRAAHHGGEEQEQGPIRQEHERQRRHGPL